MRRDCPGNCQESKYSKYLPWLLVAVALIFYPVFFAGFTNWDDPSYITANPLIRSLSPSGLWTMFATAHRGLYKPLVMLSYAQEYALAGLNPFLYHLDNLLLHLANTALAFFLLRCFVKERTALLATIIFALHPLRVESVAWLPERKDLLCGFFVFTSLLCYCKYREGWKKGLWLSVAAYTLSLLANAKAIALPAAILLLCVADKKNKRQTLLETGIFALPSLLLAALNIVMLTGGRQTPSGAGLLENSVMAAQGFNIYALKTLFPYPLSALYPYPQGFPESIPALYYFAPLAAAAILYTLWRTSKLSDAARAGAVFYLLMLVPLLNWLPIQPGIAMEHLTYLSGLGSALLLAELFFITHESCPAKTRQLMLAALVCVIALLAGLTNARTRVWHDSVSLWTDRIAHYPDSYLAYANRGAALAARGKQDLALADIDKALELKPEFRMALLLKANILYAKNDLPGAQSAVRSALAIKGRALPGQDVWDTEAQLRTLSGRIFLRQDNRKAALEEFDAALAANGAHLAALTGMVQLYLEDNRFNDALMAVSEAVKNNPRSAGHLNLLGSLLAQKGDWKDAREAYEKAIAADPSFAEPYKNLAVVCANIGDSQASAKYAAKFECISNSHPAQK